MENFLRLFLFFVTLNCTLLIACSKKQHQTPSNVVIHGRGGDSVGLDPAQQSDGESFKVSDNIFSTLVQFKEGSTEIAPDLAVSWTISPDGLRYRFKLREGVFFHDDTPFNADAVLFSFNRQRLSDHPYHNVGGAWEYWQSMSMSKIIKDIIKIDDYQVEFILHQPEAPFLSNLAMDFAAIVSPAAVEKYKSDFGRNPVGTGPFKFKKWIKNQIIELEAFPKYYAGKPAIDRLIFKNIPDNSSRFLELISGKIDVMDTPNPSDLAKLENQPELKVHKQAGMNVGYLAMHTQKGPFKNKKVRQAINHAVNKKAILDQVYEGLGEIAHGPIPPSLWGFNPNIKSYEYDIEKAKSLLKEAGYPNGFKSSLWALPVARAYMPDGKKVAEVIQADLAKINVQVDIISMEWSTYLERLSKGEHEMALIGWIGDNGDPDNFLYMLLDKDAAQIPAQNYSFFINDTFHKLLIEAKRSTDFKQRTTLYQKAQEIVHEEAPWVPIAHSIEVLPMKKNLVGLTLEPTGKRRYANAKWVTLE